MKVKGRPRSQHHVQHRKWQPIVWLQMLVGAEAVCCNSLPNSAGLEEAQQSPGVCGTAWNCMLKTMVIVSVVPSGKWKTHSNCSALKIWILFPWQIPMGYQQTRYSSGTSSWEWITLAAAGGKEIPVIVTAWNEQAATTLKMLSDTCFSELRLQKPEGSIEQALLFYAVKNRTIILCSYAQQGSGAIAKYYIVRAHLRAHLWNQPINQSQLSIHGRLVTWMPVLQSRNTSVLN